MSAVNPMQAGAAHRGEGDDLASEQNGNSPGTTIKQKKHDVKRERCLS